MLDNIIGQNVQTLRQELTDGCFPSAALFFGPPYTAKLSTALEVARVLTCEQRQGTWSCGCASCRKQRLLTHPYTLLLGYRYFIVEISAAADVLRRTRKEAARYLFVRAVRKLTRRFDPVFWEGEKIGGWQSAIPEIEETLDMLSPESVSLEPDEKLEDRLNQVISGCRTLARALSEETIPINQIRRAVNWLHMTSSAENARKILILENADRMHDAPSNSLLKLLEEPPPQVSIILITTRKGAMMPTILSRLRPYAFMQRSRESEGQVLQRVFRENPEDYSSLREYFLFWKELNPDVLSTLVRRFVDLMLKDSGSDSKLLQDMADLLKNNTGREFLSAFFEELLISYRELLHSQSIDTQILIRHTQIVRQQYDALKRYHRNPLLAFETLYYGLGRKR